MTDGIVEFLRVTGTGGLVFLVFYIYHQASTKQMNDIIDKTFKLLSTMIEQNTLQLSYLQKIDTEISNNVWCPLVRKSAGKTKEGVECG